MSNTSATGGFLVPSNPQELLEGQALTDYLHQWISGIIGMSGDLLRPRWQAEPPDLPGDGITWGAFGIVGKTPDFGQYQEHIGAGIGQDRIKRHETIEILVSLYGPSADLLTAYLREGMWIGQNRDLLIAKNMDVLTCDASNVVPEFIKQKWLNRVDTRFYLRRQIVLSYPILNIASGDITLNTEVDQIKILVNN